MVMNKRNFNGKVYQLEEIQKDKRIAIQHKKKLIVKGYLVRVIPVRRGEGGYAIYTRFYRQS